MIISIPQGLKTAFSSTVGKQTAAKVSSQTLVVLHRPLETKSQCALSTPRRGGLLLSQGFVLALCTSRPAGF